MSLMDQVQKGRTPKPPRILCYGVEGVGNSRRSARNLPSPFSFSAKMDWTKLTATSFRSPHRMTKSTRH